MASALQLISVMQTDEVFVGRVKVACDLLEADCTPDLLRQVAVSVVGSVTTDGFGNVDTGSVSDADLLAALGTLTDKEEEAMLMATLLPSEITVTTPSFGVAGGEAEAMAAMETQLEVVATENRLLAARVAALDGKPEIAVSLLRDEVAPDVITRVLKVGEEEAAPEPAPEPVVTPGKELTRK